MGIAGLQLLYYLIVFGKIHHQLKVGEGGRREEPRISVPTCHKWMAQNGVSDSLVA